MPMGFIPGLGTINLTATSGQLLDPQTGQWTPINPADIPRLAAMIGFSLDQLAAAPVTTPPPASIAQPAVTQPAATQGAAPVVIQADDLGLDQGTRDYLESIGALGVQLDPGVSREDVLGATATPPATIAADDPRLDQATRDALTQMGAPGVQLDPGLTAEDVLLPQPGDTLGFDPSTVSGINIETPFLDASDPFIDEATRAVLEELGAPGVQLDPIFAPLDPNIVAEEVQTFPTGLIGIDQETRDLLDSLGITEAQLDPLPVFADDPRLEAASSGFSNQTDPDAQPPAESDNPEVQQIIDEIAAEVPVEVLAPDPEIEPIARPLPFFDEIVSTPEGPDRIIDADGNVGPLDPTPLPVPDEVSPTPFADEQEDPVVQQQITQNLSISSLIDQLGGLDAIPEPYRSRLKKIDLDTGETKSGNWLPDYLFFDTLSFLLTQTGNDPNSFFDPQDAIQPGAFGSTQPVSSAQDQDTTSAQAPTQAQVDDVVVPDAPVTPSIPVPATGNVAQPVITPAPVAPTVPAPAPAVDTSPSIARPSPFFDNLADPTVPALPPQVTTPPVVSPSSSGAGGAGPAPAPISPVQGAGATPVPSSGASNPFGDPFNIGLPSQFNLALQGQGINPFGTTGDLLSNSLFQPASSVFLAGGQQFSGNDPFTQFINQGGLQNLPQQGSDLFQNILGSTDQNDPQNLFQDPSLGSDAAFVLSNLARLGLSNNTNRSFSSLFGQQLLDSIEEQFNFRQQTAPTTAGTLSGAFNTGLGLGF